MKRREPRMAGCSRFTNEQGVALFSVFLAILMMTVLGIASLTVTGLENRMAGFASSMEASAAAAESCVATGVKVLQQIRSVANADTIPAVLLSNATPPGPVPFTNKAQLEAEVSSSAGAVPDVPIGPPFPVGITVASPNLSINVPGYTVVGDIDYLYLRPIPGSTPCHTNCYQGGNVQGGGVEHLYKIDCVATHTVTGMSSRIMATYACVFNEECQVRP